MSRRRPIQLSGARVVLTGASSGIGRALALRLAEEGAHLLLVARRTELLNGVVDDIARASGPSARAITADLSVQGAAAEVASSALDHFSREIDIVINNAGRSLVGAQSALGDAESARNLVEINLWSPLALTAAVLPTMLSAGRGAIVNVTSTIQSVPLPLLGYYGSSKSALAQATKSLRLELAQTPIRVVEIVPGSTDTALRDIDELPWRGDPPKTPPPVSPQSSAAAIARGLKRGSTRITFPRYSAIPLTVPAFGTLVARVVGRRVDTSR